MQNRFKRRVPSRQRGMSLVIVLVSLTVMLLGALSVAKTTDSVGFLTSNRVQVEKAEAISEIGLTAGLNNLGSLASEDVDVLGVYLAAMTGPGVDQFSSGFDWSSVPEQKIGELRYRVIVERMCQGPLPVADFKVSCMSKEASSNNSRRSGAAALDVPSVRLFRITVQVTAPRGGVSLVQMMAERGFT